MLKKSCFLACLFTLAIGMGISQPASQPTNTGNLSEAAQKQLDQVKKDAMAAKIELLTRMSSKDRIAFLKDLDRSERRGLWLQIKKEKAFREGQTGRRDGQYAKSFQKPRQVETGATWNSDRAVGTITYDSGAPTVSFGGGSIVGNRFNTHTAIPVLANGTVETVQAVVVQGSSVTTSSAGFVLHGPQTTMGGALALFSSFAGATGATDTLTFSGLGVNYTGSSFYVLFGDFSNSYIPVLGTGSAMGQGFHGVVGYTGGMGPNITGTFNLGGSLNAFVRAGGNIVPVELMKFEVE